MIISTLNKLKTYIRLLSQKKVIIDSSMAGMRIKPFQFSVDARQISNYAAAISDLNDIYYTSEKNNITYAHPIFPVRISWDIIKNLPEYLEKAFPLSIENQLVHQSEYLQINRMPRPGDLLTLKGEIAALTPHPRGAKIVLKFDYYDQSERLICTEYIGSILFGVKCADPGKGLDSIPQVKRIDKSEPIWVKNIPISRMAPYIYDGCTDIVYPVHTDQKFARSMGLRDIILQGTATLAMSVSTILKEELNNNPKQIEIVAGKFTDVVIPPNNLSVQLLKKSQRELFFDVKEESGKFVIMDGYIKTK